jgi:uncharacterized coiled-coil protein SlyX
MSDAIRPPGPDYPPTKQIPKVSVPQNTLDAVLSEVRAMRLETADKFVEMSTRMSKMEARLDDEMSSRLSKMEARIDAFDERGAKHSGGVRQLSETDAKHDAAIALLHTKVDRLDTALAANNADTTAIKKAVSGLLKEHPQLVTGLVGLVMAAISFATAWFSRGH